MDKIATSIRHRKNQKKNRGNKMNITMQELNKFTEQYALSDQAIQSDDTPWIPNGDGAFFKPLRFDLATGTWINLVKITKSGTVNRHRHTGGPVIGFTIEGEWRYLERDWVARKGTLIYEPPGDVHTLVVDSDEGMITLFMMSGSLQFLNDKEEIVEERDAFTVLRNYLEYCKKHDIPAKDLIF